MKILLVVPAKCDLIHSVSLPLGLISIGTYLKEYGHEVKLIDPCVTHVSISKTLKDFQPDIIGLSIRSQKQILSAVSISKKAHKMGIPVVWGGPICNIAPIEHFFAEEYIDILSFSEGEMTWVDLADTLEKGKPLDDVKGIAFRKNGKIIRTPDREFMDLSKILPSDWSLVDVPKYFTGIYSVKKLVYVYLSKGCPGHCSFCYNSYFHRSCVRRKSVEVFMTEIKQLVEVYGIDGFYLADEYAFSKKSDIYELCDALDATGYKLGWGFETRIGLLDKSDLQRLYDSGCRWIHFGIETASPRMMKRINKNIPFDKVIPTFEWCNEVGIIPVSSFVIGMPGETVEDLQYNVELAKKLPNCEISFFKYAYIYDSPFGREIFNSGKYKLPEKLLDSRKIDLYHSRTPNFSQIPMRDLNVVQGYFFWDLLTKSDYDKKEKNVLHLFKQFKILLNRVFHINIRFLPEAVLTSAIPLFRFFFAAKFCKKTRKKYGLD